LDRRETAPIGASIIAPLASQGKSRFHFFDEFKFVMCVSSELGFVELLHVLDD